MVKKLKKCPECDFEGLMECLSALRCTGENYTCPNCGHTFGNLRHNKPNH